MCQVDPDCLVYLLSQNDILTQVSGSSRIRKCYGVPVVILTLHDPRGLVQTGGCVRDGIGDNAAHTAL